MKPIVSSDCDAFPCEWIIDEMTVLEYEEICKDCELRRLKKL